MNSVLLLILIFLIILICGKRGLKLILSLGINFTILIILFYFITLGINPLLITLLALLLISNVILYFVNGKNKKTKSSMPAVFIILIVLLLSILIITKETRIQGFGYESYEEINMFSYDVNIDFTNITTCLILIGLIGATIDASIAISSALHEVYENNKHLEVKALFKSGLTIGKDIMGTTVNTLLFAFLGEFMTLLIWYKTGNYMFEEIINNKTFAQELIKILFSAIGCILIVPLTSIITSYRLKHDNEEEYYNEE